MKTRHRRRMKAKRGYKRGILLGLVAGFVFTLSLMDPVARNVYAQLVSGVISLAPGNDKTMRVLQLRDQTGQGGFLAVMLYGRDGNGTADPLLNDSLTGLLVKISNAITGVFTGGDTDGATWSGKGVVVMGVDNTGKDQEIGVNVDSMLIHGYSTPSTLALPATILRGPDNQGGVGLDGNALYALNSAGTSLLAVRLGPSGGLLTNSDAANLTATPTPVPLATAIPTPTVTGPTNVFASLAGAYGSAGTTEVSVNLSDLYASGGFCYGLSGAATINIYEVTGANPVTGTANSILLFSIDNSKSTWSWPFNTSPMGVQYRPVTIASGVTVTCGYYGRPRQ